MTRCPSRLCPANPSAPGSPATPPPARVTLRLLALVLALFPLRSAAQTEPFDASWYHPDQPYLKIAVVEDGLYRLTGASLSAAGVPVEGIDPTTFQLFENGREIPLYREGSGTTLQPEEALVFVGPAQHRATTKPGPTTKTHHCRAALSTASTRIPRPTG
ncbi:MAG: hypothetical protein KatS3mg044_0943 [Rhodothermaceae bacterium]|nr:MAG: hypothetical protein KatS3mg044_0943 [Rhodothermaceae bacterium]